MADHDDDTGTSLPGNDDVDGSEEVDAAPPGAEPAELPPVTSASVGQGDVGEVAGGAEITDVGEDSPSS